MKSKFDYFKGGRPAGFSRLVLTVLCLGFVTSGFAQESASAGISVQGRVSGQDEEGNNAGVIANATVELLRAGGSPAGTETTNETGFYQITGLQPGDYTYRVSADGYSSEDAGRGINIPNGGDGFVLDFILTNGDLTPPATGSLSGQVLVEKDEVRTPGIGAKVVASRSAGKMVVERSVDEQGNYHLDLPSGEWKMSAILPNRPPHVNPEIVTTDPNTPATVDFIFFEIVKEEPPAPTDVHLLSSVPAGGGSAAAPTVNFVNRETSEMKSAKVNPATEAQLLAGGLSPDKRTESLTWFYAAPAEPLPEGSFFAEANLEGFDKALSTERKVTAGEEIWFDVAFVPVKKVDDIDLTDQGTPGDPAMPTVPGVRGRVSGVHESGEYLGVVAGAKIEFLNGSGNVVATATTNETGFYEVDTLGAGNWTYRVTAANFVAEDAGRGFELDETSGIQVYDFSLFKTIAEPPSSGIISGLVSRIKGEGTEPLSGTMVSLRRTDGGFITSVTSGADGTFRVDVPVADWKVSALTTQFKASVFPSIVSVVSGEDSIANFIFPEKFIPEVKLNNSVLALVSVATGPDGKTAIPAVEFVSVEGQSRIPGNVEQIPDAELTKMGIKRQAEGNPWDWYRAKPDQALPKGNYNAQGKLAGYTPAKSASKQVGELLLVTFDMALSLTKSPGDKPIDMPPITDVPKGPEKPGMPDSPDTPVQPVPVDLPKVMVTVVDIEGVPISGVDIRLVDKTRGKSLSEADQVFSSETGVGSFDLSDGFGDYALMASLSGFDTIGEEITVTEKSFALTLTLFKEGVPRLVDLTGVVVEKTPGQDGGHPDGKKVVNASITFKVGPDSKLPESLTGSLRTDENGSFSAKGVSEGIYDVVILAEGYVEFSGNVQVVRDMGQPLFALDPRNMARDNWIKMILTEAWGDSERARQLHVKGLAEDNQDSNVDFALGLACLPSADDTTAIRGFEGAVGKVNQELWWDRACEGYIWTLMRHDREDATVAEIRRLVSDHYSDREASSESQATANMIGVAVGVLIGPWSSESTAGDYAALDQEVSASLKEPLLTSYLEGRNSVKVKLQELTDAEEKSNQEMADASAKEKQQMISALEGDMNVIKGQLGENAKVIESKNEGFEQNKNEAVAVATDLTEQIAEFQKQLTGLEADIENHKQQMESDSKNRARDLLTKRLQEIEGGLQSNATEIARIEAENEALTGNMAEIKTAVTEYGEAIENAKTNLSRIRAEIATIKQEIQNAIANNTAMQGGLGKRLQEISQGLTANQQAQQAQEIVVQDYPSTAFAGFDNRLQQIVNELNVISEQLPGARARDQEAASNMINGQMANLQASLNNIDAQLQNLDQNFANMGGSMDGFNQQLNQISIRIQEIQTRLEVLSNESEFCEECRQFSEQPPNCPDCINHRQHKETETLSLNQEWTNLAANWEQINNAKQGEEANSSQASETYERERTRLLGERDGIIAMMNNPVGNGEQGMVGEEANLLRRDTELRAEYDQESQNRQNFADNDYLRIDGENRQRFQNLINAGIDLENQYNAIAEQMNNTPDGNMQDDGRLQPLEDQETQWKTYLAEVEAGLRTVQGDDPSGTVAENNQTLIRLRQIADELTADYHRTSGQLSNPDGMAPNGEEGLSDSKTTELTHQINEHQSRVKNMQADLLGIQTGYAEEDAAHKKEIESLNQIAVDLTGQYKELEAKLGALPDTVGGPAGKPKVGGTDFTQMKESILTYRSYPVEQRRDELLNWVTREVTAIR